MTTKTKPQKLVTIDELVKQHKGNVAAAARAAGVTDYIQFRRWYKRLVFAPDHSATRELLEERGIQLPHRPAKAKR